MELRLGGGVWVIGNLVCDVLVTPVEQITFDRTTWVERIEQHLGGNGANTSFALAKLGVPVALSGTVGQDAFGELVLKRLRSTGVNLDRIVRSLLPTATTIVLVKPDGARAFLHHPGSSADAFCEAVDPPVGDYRHFHLGNLFALPHLRTGAPALLKSARQSGMTTSLDLGWDAKNQWHTLVGPCLPHTDVLFANEEEAHMLTGLTGDDAAKQLLREGPQLVVIKRGRHGCVLYTSSGCSAVAGFAVEAIDSTGAGDCFAGGFLAALHHGQPLPNAARFANAVGALNVQTLGSTTGLLSYANTLAWMNQQG